VDEEVSPRRGGKKRRRKLALSHWGKHRREGGRDGEELGCP
jgi:hypothetical protein